MEDAICLRGKTSGLTSACHVHNVSSWRRSDSLSYFAAYRHGWLAQCCAHMSPKVKRYQRVEVVAAARDYRTVADWRHARKDEYQAAVRNGWFGECTRHIEGARLRPRKRWTKQECLESARRHPTIKDWTAGDPRPRFYAASRGWLKECASHMVALSRSWSKKECLREAKKYRSKTEWWKRHPKTYHAALCHGWLTECARHMGGGCPALPVRRL